MRTRIAYMAAVIALAGCTKPMDVVIPSDVSAWDKDLAPAILKLGPDEQKIVQGYLMRMKIAETLSAGQQGIPVGFTVRQAIADQRSWMAEKEKELAEQHAKAEEEKALKERLAKQAQAAKAELQNAVTVVLLSKEQLPSNPSAGRYSGRQNFSIGVTNRTHKRMTGVSGELELMDLFEKVIGSVSFRIAETIEPGSDVRWVGGRDYNQFISTHKAVWNIEEGQYSTRFIPETILFADGSKLQASN